MIEVVEFVSKDGGNPFRKWVGSLDEGVAGRVYRLIARMQQGNLGDVKPVGMGVSESRIHTGPGYQIYFAKDGERLIFLLGVGTKKRQQRDIKIAQSHWAEYKQRKRSDE